MDLGMRLLPYTVAILVGSIVFFVSDIALFGIATGIATWLWCAGYVPGPLAYLEKREREKRGIPELKFKVGDRVSTSNTTGIECGTVSELSPKREMFAVFWDFGGKKWHTVFDQDLFDAVDPSANPQILDAASRMRRTGRLKI